MTRLTILALVLMGHLTYGQTLALDDIISLRTMDSVELRTFCYDKGFELREVEIDAWRSIHKYYAMADNSVSLVRNFPTAKKFLFFSRDTTTRDHRMVYYNYADKEVLKGFKREMKEKGFEFKRRDTEYYEGNRYTHNIYLKEDWEIDLASEKRIGEKTEYTLMYYRRLN